MGFKLGYIDDDENDGSDDNDDIPFDTSMFLKIGGKKRKTKQKKKHNKLSKTKKCYFKY
jgi:hypothetical protein